MLKIAPYLYYSQREDNIYVKNLYSPLNAIVKLSPNLSKRFQKLVNTKKIGVLDFFTILKFIALDILVFKWKDGSNYNIKEIPPEQNTFMTFWIHMTNNCNFACKYCYVRKTAEDIEAKVVERLPQLISELKDNGYEKIKFKFAGGEPLLNFKTLKKIFYSLEKVATENNIKTEYTIISNGSVVDSEIIKFLKANPKIRLSISLDGIGEDHDANRIFKDGSGTFKIVSKNIDKLVNSGIAPYLSVTVTDKSVKNLPKLFEFINKRHLAFSLNIVRAFNTTKDIKDKNKKDQEFIDAYVRAIRDYEKYLSPFMSVTSIFADRANLNTVHLHTCSVERNYVVLDHKGRLYKCQMFLGSKYSIGTIFDRNWLQKIRPVKPRFNLSVNDKEPCNKCKWKYLCSGGCPLTTYFEYNDSHHSNPFCNLYQRILPEILELEITRLHKFNKIKDPI